MEAERLARLALTEHYKKEVYNVDEVYEAAKCVNWAMTDCRESGAGSECSVFAWDCWERLTREAGLGDILMSTAEKYGIGINSYVAPTVVPVHAGVNIFVFPVRVAGRRTRESVGTAFAYAWHKIVGHDPSYILDESNMWVEYRRSRSEIRSMLSLLNTIRREVPAVGRRRLKVSEVARIGEIILDRYPDVDGVVAISAGFYWPNTNDARRVHSLARSIAGRLPYEPARFVRHFAHPIIAQRMSNDITITRFGAIILVGDVDEAVARIRDELEFWSGWEYRMITGRAPTIIEVEGHFLSELSTIRHYLEPITVASRTLGRILEGSRYIGRAVRAAEWAARIIGWIDDFLVATRVSRHLLMGELGEIPFVDIAVLALDVIDIIWHYKEYAEAARKAMNVIQQNVKPLVLNVERAFDAASNGLRIAFEDIYKLLTGH